MTKVKEYEFRIRGDQCDHLATLCHDTETKANFKEIARRWRELANDVERIGR
jgi:hypothetical protein